MQLPPERESELVEQNMPKIYRAIDNFMSRCNRNSGVRLSYDDCVQEVALAFLKYIRRCDSEGKMDIFPWHDAMNAMSRLVLQSQPLSVPLRTQTFNEIIHSLPQTVSYDVLVSNGVDVDGMSRHWVPDEETMLDFDSFMSSQDENLRRIASMRLRGMTYRDIAGQCGISKSLVERKIKTLRENYNEFDKEDSEIE